MRFDARRDPVTHTPPAQAAVATAARAIAYVLALFLAGAVAPVPAVPAVPAATADPAASAQAVLQADAQYAKFDYEAALTTCRAALARDSTSYDLWWRLARSLDDRGARANYDNDKPKAEAAFSEAVTAGRRAVVLGSEKPDGHVELSIALGRLALFKGGKEKLRLSKEIKSEADRALAIDPKQHRAEHVLGRWNRSIAELSIFEKAAANTIMGGLPKGATKEAAVTHFERAIELAPEHANHHLELGRTLLGLGLKAKARAEFEKTLACPLKSPFDTEYKQQAQQLMAKTQ
jgi:tetratricopeptide (TPR) repeat protein